MAEAPAPVTRTQGRPSAPIPKHLRELRVEQGLTLARLAALANLDPPTLSMIERGKHAATPEQAIALSEALGAQLTYAVMLVHWEPA